MDRQERRRRTAKIVDRRKEVMCWSNMLEWVDDRYIGRCKTLHPLDCGRPRCGVCRTSRKWLGKTRQEKAAEEDAKCVANTENVYWCLRALSSKQ